MASDVEKTLHDIIQTFGKMSSSAADVCLHTLKVIPTNRSTKNNCLSDFLANLIGTNRICSGQILVHKCPKFKALTLKNYNQMGQVLHIVWLYFYEYVLY